MNENTESLKKKRTQSMVKATSKPSKRQNRGKYDDLGTCKL